MEEVKDRKVVVSYIRHFALFKSISPMESDVAHKMRVVISTYFIRLLCKSHEITRSEHYLYTVNTRSNTSYHHYFYVHNILPSTGWVGFGGGLGGQVPAAEVIP